MPVIDIAGRRIGRGEPTYIVAEISANHGQEFEQAASLLRAARGAGVDAVKLQTYMPNTLTLDCDTPHFQAGEGTLWEGRRLYDLYDEAYTPWEWQPRLSQIANELGLTLFSTPFDASAVEFLEEMAVPAYKIASFEIVDLPLLKRVAATGKPIILSTGLCTLEEIEEAVITVRASGCKELALLKCTSGYPAAAEEMNLRTIPHLAEAFGVVSGLSDHTLGISVPIAAVALGANIVEKHFTLSRTVSGPDSAFSLEPCELTEMVEAIRVTERALGEVRYGPGEKESKSLRFRRSLFVVDDVKQGEVFTKGNVRSIRPGFGLHTRHLDEIIGRVASRDILRGTPVTWDLVAGGETGVGPARPESRGGPTNLRG